MAIRTTSTEWGDVVGSLVGKYDAMRSGTNFGPIPAIVVREEHRLKYNN